MIGASNIKNPFSFHLEEYLTTNLYFFDDWFQFEQRINIKCSRTRTESLLQFGINSFVAFVKHWARVASELRKQLSNCSVVGSLVGQFLIKTLTFKADSIRIGISCKNFFLFSSETRNPTRPCGGCGERASWRGGGRERMRMRAGVYDRRIAHMERGPPGNPEAVVLRRNNCGTRAGSRALSCHLMAVFAARTPCSRYPRFMARSGLNPYAAFG